MRSILQTVVLMGAVTLGAGFCAEQAMAQNDSSVELNVRILDMSGNGDDHWTVAWVTKADGNFIKTIWRQGPSMTSSRWNDHCKKYYTTRSNTVLDGYSSSTARDYNSPNSPVIQSWDCRDAAGNLMPDGDYRFWVQYAEDVSHSIDGPYTTVGLLWTKGAAPSTTTYANQGSNFSSMSVVWSPALPPNAAITSIDIQGSAIIITGTGTVGAAYTLVGQTNLDESVIAWTSVGSGSISESGSFSNSIPIDPESSSGFYRLTLP